MIKHQAPPVSPGWGNRRLTSTMLVVLSALCSIYLSLHPLGQNTSGTTPTHHTNHSNFLLSPDINFNILNKVSIIYTTDATDFLRRRMLNIRTSSLLRANYAASRHAWLRSLLFLAGDLQLNPGPKSRTVTAPCGVCSKACTWKQTAVACDSCDTWYHTKCMGMNSFNYNLHTANPNISWICCSCGIPTFTSSLFDDMNLSNDSYPCSPVSTHTNHNSVYRTPRHFNRNNNSFEVLSPTSAFRNGATSPRGPTPISSSTPMQPKQTTHPKQTKKHPPKPKNLRILTLNFHSLKNKREIFSQLVEEKQPDVFIGSETWFHTGILNSELLLDDYNIFRRDRPRPPTTAVDDERAWGGVLIGVRKCLTAVEIHSGAQSESIYCKISLEGKRPIIIGALYRPPHSPLQESTELCSDLVDLFHKNKSAVFWIGGDFNLPDICWKREEVVSYQYLKPISTLFLDLSHDLGLKQLVQEPTRINSLLDLFFTNTPGLILNCSTTSGICDHEAVLIETTIQPNKKKPIKRKIHLWNKIDIPTIQKEVHQLSTSLLETFSVEDNVNEIWLFLKTGLESIMHKNIPTKFTSSKTHQPWINTETKRLIRRKNRWFQRAKKCNSERVWNKYRDAKAKAQTVCRRTYQNYISNLITEDFNNKKLWAFIKSKRVENVGISDLKNNLGFLTHDPQKKANILNEQFSSVFSDPTSVIENPLSTNMSFPDIQRIRIDRTGLIKLLLNIKINKAVGPDGIPGRLLKLCAHEIVDSLITLFQASLDQGVVPDDWKEANIMPLFKKGDKTSAENYRPISLTSVSCKLLEHIVHSNIMRHFDQYNILNDDQHGFRKFRSCESQLITTINDFSEGLNKEQQIDAIFLDFSKAFDKVDHSGLLLKLKDLGVRDSLLKWIQSFLSNRSQKVIVEGMASSPKPVLSGVPQGTVLGPLLFLVYINDINEGLSQGTKIKLFADDSLLYRTIKTPLDAKILQDDLNTLQKWEINWKMEFHPGKCQLLRVTNKKNIIPYSYSIHNEVLQEAESVKYLGVIIDKNLTWKKQYSNINKKASNILALLRRNTHSLPLNVKKTCYNALVQPILEYGCCVWDPYLEIDKLLLDKIQKRGARYVTNNYCMEHGSTETNLDQLEWRSLEERRSKLKLSMLYKARHGQIEIPIKHLRINTRDSSRFEGPTYTLPYSRVDSHLHSFFPSVVRLWNPLTGEAKECESLSAFKAAVDSHYN